LQSTARDASFAAMKEELLKVLPNENGQKAITVKQDGTRLTIALSSNWLFASGEAALTPDGMTMLKRIGTVLGPLSDKFVQVAGHTDNQTLSKALQKTFPDNKALSWARAENARRALVTGGMSAERTKAVGLADSRPIASNATEQGRQKNRRLELVIVQGPTVASATGKTIDDRDHLAALAPSY
jgi:chemotaxis protein MotB